MSWTQAVCDDCWDERYSEGRRKSPRKGMGDTEICCWCGKDTNSGIYVREDPMKVNFA